jgi:hypothetical protein
VLACAASNVAVDNLVERLAAQGSQGGAGRLSVVRMGHPARLLPQVRRGRGASQDTRPKQSSCLPAAVGATGAALLAACCPPAVAAASADASGAERDAAVAAESCGTAPPSHHLPTMPPPQVLENSLEARVLQSDNSALAKDCRKEMKALNGRLLKLGGWRVGWGVLGGRRGVGGGWGGAQAHLVLEPGAAFCRRLVLAS